jgi:hypothetical protein
MNTTLTPLCGSNLQRVALLELMVRAKAAEAGPTNVPGGDAADAADLPEAVRAVLCDERAEQLIPRLVATNAMRLLFDINTLAHACERIERQWWEEALLQYFVGAQASTAMIQALFRHITRSRIGRLRRDLHAAPPTKPLVLNDHQIRHLFDLWRVLQATALDVRERYIELHQRCGGRYTLATLFAALNTDHGGRQ